MPTGGGKSITFQVPAMVAEGICLVITPLIALMKDQVQNLRAKGIKAAAVYSGMTSAEIIVALDNCILGNYKFLYISPERLSTDIFLLKLRRMKVCMITVDEAHCISQWGYDFRPSYLHIADIRKFLPGIPVLALTATATPQVIKDIQSRLNFKEENVFRMSFERKNLAYIVCPTENKQKEMLYLLQKIAGSAIIYVRSRKRTKEIVELLCQKGMTADFYHAGLNNEIKDARQKKWQAGACRVMVATNAFGMGIDKPDVRLVIHLDLPDSVEAYFQEAGRAGRDGKKAYAILLHSRSDKANLSKRIPDTFPEKEYIKQIYEHLNFYYQMAMGDGRGCTYDFNLEDFCYKFKHYPVPVDSALKILARAGYIEYTDEQDNASRLIFLLRRDELYKLKEGDEKTELVIQTVLRVYSGLFTDYAYIREDTLAQRTGLTRQQVYECLVNLSKRRIIDYIPSKRTPFIIYTRERVELCQLHLSEEVYDKRKACFISRINAMIDYATSHEICRSRLLLSYFGEKNTHDCMQCDVCVPRYPQESGKEEFGKLEKEILRFAAQGIQEIDEIALRLNQPKEKIGKLFRYLLNEEKLKIDDKEIG